jgi:hypothetical protein
VEQSRRAFLATGAAGAASAFRAARGTEALAAGSEGGHAARLTTDAAPAVAAKPWPASMRRHATRPLAITMWDFSWLERRWPGAGYERWDEALDALAERGYDAVRIDAYPHLVAADPSRTWDILPCWNQQDWGAPALVRVQVQPQLNAFITACKARGLSVALSTWFREDPERHRQQITNPQALGRIWTRTLDTIAQAGLIDRLLYVDLCNEFPLDVWAPFLPAGTRRHSADGARWMREAIAVVREAYPQLACTFSFTSEYETWRSEDVSMHDLLELHCWMTHWNDFYEQVGYHYERFESKGYENLVARGESTYRAREAYWRQSLAGGIGQLADWSRASGLPLITTECWGIVDYKDWPLLDWGWVKELCELGVRTAAGTGRWAAMATSNFCGPQFRGMWRDVAWHRRLTDVIHAATLPQ